MFPIKSHKITYHSHKNHLKLPWLSHSVAMTSMKSPQKCHKNPPSNPMVRCMPPYHPRWPSAAPAGSFRRPQGWTSAPWGRNLAKKNDDFPLYNQGEGLIICNPGLPDMFFLPPRNKSKAAQIRMGVFSAFVLKGRMYLAKPPKWGCSDQCPELPTTDQPLMPRPAAAISPTDPGMATRCKPRSWSTP